jgi:hypothetical protein
MSYDKLTSDSAKKAEEKYLLEILNYCRPDSGPYIIAKAELDRRNNKWRETREWLNTFTKLWPIILVIVTAALGGLAYVFNWLSI